MKTTPERENKVINFKAKEDFKIKLIEKLNLFQFNKQHIRLAVDYYHFNYSRNSLKRKYNESLSKIDLIINRINGVMMDVEPKAYNNSPEMDIVGSSYKLLYVDEVGECVGKMN